MTDRMLQPKVAWAEDRATQRCDPSADPGAKTGAGARHSLALLPFHPLRDWHESDKPSRHEAATLLAGCRSQFANAERHEFQFPVNQHSRGWHARWLPPIPRYDSRQLPSHRFGR
jgi:hypothetical protein